MKIKKIILIYPGKPFISVNAPPLGLLCLAGGIINKNYSVRIIDRSINKNDELLGDADLIGISVMGQISEVKKICRKVRKKSVAPIILGGCLPSLDPEFFLKEIPEINYIIRHEGDFAFSKLIDYLNGKRSIEEIENLCYLDSGKIINNPTKIVENLDLLPMPAFKLANLDAYIEMNKKFLKMTKRNPPLIFPLEISRSCPYQCKFCTARLILGDKWRTKSPERAILELKELFKIYPPDKYNLLISYVDNNFISSRKWINSFFELVKSEDLKFKWSCSSRVTDISREVLGKLKDIGLQGILMGGESGSSEGLKNINKKIELTDLEKAVKICNELNINAVLTYMIGFPWESKDLMRKTLESALNAFETNPKRMAIRLYKFAPQYTTDLWEELVSKGLLDQKKKFFENFWINSGLVYKHPKISASEIDLLVAWFFLKYILLIIKSGIKIYRDNPIYNLDDIEKRINSIVNIYLKTNPMYKKIENMILKLKIFVKSVKSNNLELNDIKKALINLDIKISSILD
ncbi:MAG: B12-binding domain-containing radical SAM protein [Candidatus Helarchaeota archaeon]